MILNASMKTLLIVSIPRSFVLGAYPFGVILLELSVTSSAYGAMAGRRVR